MLHSLRGSSNHNYAGKVRAEAVLMLGFTQKFTLKEECSRRAFFYHFQDTMPAGFEVSFFILYYLLFCVLPISRLTLSLFPVFCCAPLLSSAPDLVADP
jgi:hypothetical protein